jgi:pyridoxal 5'-phosphate synthase pdxT subunit
MTVGILALQGGFQEHEEMLHRIGVETRQVRLPDHLNGVEHLIIPGGESTTIGKLLVHYHLVAPIRQRAGADLAVWGTCAGAILLAQTIHGRGSTDQPHLGLMDIAVHRNAFGRQINSFETDLDIPVLGTLPVHAVFIRAPMIDAVGQNVDILARLPEQESIVAVRQGRLLAATFHPELTSDDRFHRYFLGL